MNELIVLLTRLAEVFFVFGVIVFGFGLVVRAVSPTTGATIMRAGMFALTGGIVCMIGVVLMA